MLSVLCACFGACSVCLSRCVTSACCMLGAHCAYHTLTARSLHTPSMLATRTACSLCTPCMFLGSLHSHCMPAACLLHDLFVLSPGFYLTHQRPQPTLRPRAIWGFGLGTSLHPCSHGCSAHGGPAGVVGATPVPFQTGAGVERSSRVQGAASSSCGRDLQPGMTRASGLGCRGREQAAPMGTGGQRGASRTRGAAVRLCFVCSMLQLWCCHPREMHACCRLACAKAQACVCKGNAGGGQSIALPGCLHTHTHTHARVQLAHTCTHTGVASPGASL